MTDTKKKSLKTRSRIECLCQRFPAILKKSLILQTDQYTPESMATTLLMLGDAGCLGLSQPFSLHTAAAPNFQQQGLWDP